MITSNDTLLSLFVLLWASRLIVGFKIRRTDLAFAVFFAVIHTVSALCCGVLFGYLSQIWLLLIAATSISLCLLLAAYFFYNVLDTHSENETSQRSSPLKPLIFPSRTSHVRLFPKMHGFSYSYLLVGVPVGGKPVSPTDCSAGKTSSEDAEGRGLMSWFKVDAGDYLERGNRHLGLRGKLEMYLRNQVRP